MYKFTKEKSSKMLGINVDSTPKKKKKEIKKPEVKNNDGIVIENFEEVVKIVKKEIEEKKLNPSAVLDGESGTNFIEGKPHLVIDDQYVPFDEAQVIIQTRKVVKEWLKLEELKNNLK